LDEEILGSEQKFIGDDIRKLVREILEKFEIICFFCWKFGCKLTITHRDLARNSGVFGDFFSKKPLQIG